MLLPAVGLAAVHVTGLLVADVLEQVATVGIDWLTEWQGSSRALGRRWAVIESIRLWRIVQVPEAVASQPIAVAAELPVRRGATWSNRSLRVGILGDVGALFIRPHLKWL